MKLMMMMMIKMKNKQKEKKNALNIHLYKSYNEVNILFYTLKLVVGSTFNKANWMILKNKK